jgi:hypothetical protein
MDAMEPELSRRFDGKKYMWDGVLYASEAEARAKEDSCAKDGFETRVLEHEGGHLVYTRRAVTGAVKAEGQ